MLNEFGASTEGLTTLGTVVGSFASADPSVLDEGCILSKTLPTGPARVGLLSLANPLVPEQVGECWLKCFPQLGQG